MPPLLEVLHAYASTPKGKPPLLFVHGAFMSARCWAKFFMPWFSERGYDCHALSLRGHGASEGREWLALASMAHYGQDLQSVIDTMPQAPILIGHSMGGLVIQNSLTNCHAPAVALLAAVPPMGCLCSLVEQALSVPCVPWGENSSLDALETLTAQAKLQQLLFTPDTPLDVIQTCMPYFQAESHRAIIDISMTRLPNCPRPLTFPLLMLGGEHDHLFPPHMVQATACHFGVYAHILKGVGHMMMLDPHWQTVAQTLYDWLESLPDDLK